MRAYSMDLRERVLRDSDAGMNAAAVAVKYHVSASWVRRLKQRRRETGEVAPRQQRVGGEFVGIRHRSIFGSREPGVPREVVAMA